MEQAAPKYMDKLFMHAAHRKMENDIRYQRRAREEKQEGDDDSEVFVTSAYKKKLEEEKEFERRMADKESAEEHARNNKKAGMGFADFHRNLLSKGMASSTNAVTDEEKRKRDAGGTEKEIAEAVQATAAAGERVEAEPVLKKEVKPEPEESGSTSVKPEADAEGVVPSEPTEAESKPLDESIINEALGEKIAEEARKRRELLAKEAALHAPVAPAKCNNDDTVNDARARYLARKKARQA